MHRHVRTRNAVGLLFLIGILFAVTPAHAQEPAPDDRVLDPAEPDFVLVNLPTTLRLPARGGNFHLSHRFNENIRQDSFGDQVSSLFGLDEGANIALEFRYGIVRSLQAAVRRTNLSRTIQLSTKYDAWHQHGSMPVSISALFSVEGDDNFRQHYAPAVGVVVSRTVAKRFAAYATPVFVANTSVGGALHRNTAFIGIGGSARVLSTTYVMGEVSPRIAGLAISDPAYALSLEKRVGRHIFALTVANGAQSTFRQLSHGGVPHGLYLGFNLGRKFF